MKRRDFLKAGAVAAGLAGTSKMVEPLLAAEGGGAASSNSPEGALKDNRTGEFVRQTQQEQYLPKAPVVAEASAGAKMTPMPLAERVKRKIVPQRGICSLAPGNGTLMCGNGAVSLELAGEPYAETVPFRHENMFVPRRRPFEAPKVAEYLPQIRQLLLEGKLHDAADLAYKKFKENPMGGGAGGAGGGGSGFSMRLEFPKSASVKDYLRTVDYESTEVKVHWTDERGVWVRETFASRPDNLVVQRMTAPQGQKVNVRVTLSGSAGGRGGARGGVGGGATVGGGGGLGNYQQDFNDQRLIIKGLLDSASSKKGIAFVTRVVCEGGTVKQEGGVFNIQDAASVMLLTRFECFDEYTEEKAAASISAVEKIAPDYAALLERAKKVQSEMLNRVTVDFGGASEYGLSSEELLSAQRSSDGFSGAFLERFFEMCRYWFILNSGKYFSVSALTNININLQIAPMALGDHREGEEAYFNWIESLMPDFRTNAKNIYGMRGAHYSINPTKDVGVETMFDHSGSALTGETWPHPYWIAAGPWCVRPFWDHYLVTGDLEFLRKRVVPAYMDLAMFLEDFLTLTDKDGNYIFAPSFSPENNPGNYNPSCMMAINAVMDISTCRETLVNLIEACETLGIEAANVAKWKAMIPKLPPYLLEPDGGLKEWAWPTLAERYVHRHVSHLYGAFPGDEVDPDRTPKLAKAMLIANRRRVHERLTAHGHCHRAQVGARFERQLHG